MAYVGQVTGANQWIAPDLQTYPASYIIHEDNSTYYAQGFGGLPNQLGTDAATVIQSAINALPSGGGKIFIKSAIYNLTTALTLVSNLTLEGESGAILQSDVTTNATLIKNNINN